MSRMWFECLGRRLGAESARFVSSRVQHKEETRCRGEH